MLITLLLVFTGCLYSFLDAMNYEASGLKKVYEGKAIYQLIDNYCSGDDFDNFRQKSDSLEILKNLTFSDIIVMLHTILIMG